MPNGKKSKNASKINNQRALADQVSEKFKSGQVPGTPRKKDHLLEKATKGLSMNQDYKYVQKYQVNKKNQINF